METEEPTMIHVGMRERGFAYEPEAAKNVLLGYCFSTSKRLSGGKYGLAASEVEVPRWAYRTYDCVSPSDGPELSDTDILVVNGLNARASAGSLATIQALAPRLVKHLETASSGEPFWELPVDDLRTPEDATRGSTGWHLQQAWALLVTAAGVGEAITHKLLHHKLPRFFPLLDNLTLPALGEDTWVQIHTDLKDQSDTFNHLETWFALQAKERPGHNVPLTRLRIHDILLWCACTGQRDAAEEAGVDLRGSAG